MTGNYTIDTKTSEKFEKKKLIRKHSFRSSKNNFSVPIFSLLCQLPKTAEKCPPMVIFKTLFYLFSKWPSRQYLTKSWKFWDEWVDLPFCEALHFFSKLIERANLSTPSVSQLNSFLHAFVGCFFQAAWFPPQTTKINSFLLHSQHAQVFAIPISYHCLLNRKFNHLSFI